VRFASGSGYRMEGTLELRNRVLKLDGNGANFKSFDRPTDRRAMWRAWDSSLTFCTMTTFGCSEIPIRRRPPAAPPRV
jgi:hypothetical protein